METRRFGWTGVTLPVIARPRTTAALDEAFPLGRSKGLPTL